ncbi:MAG: hypothetical protein GQ540_08080 [Lutibacter sp.]|uniref:hypothetical protein n=1 Tax=Lutibacter sp. TaxID=1925666 RepID=UPI0019FE298A|nr:hypothetical protein [Lutibacter sp.]NOR28470.1 hypothetical protein [Lutibacter sp.]
MFKNISTTDQYTEYRSVVDSDNDGVYEIRDRQFIVKFELKTLPTGEGYSISAIVDKGSNKGKSSTMDVVEGNFSCKGYPYESVIRDTSKKEGIVAIGDYIFFLKGISDEGTSYASIDDVYIKEGASGGNNADKPTKKKLSFKEKMKALKNASIPGATSANYGSEHKALESQNLRKLITDYLVAMKAKQDARTAKEKQSDKNILNAKEVIASKEKAKRDAEKAKRDAEWAEAKRYNDSIKATPEHQDLERRKRQNEANYQSRNGGTQGKVTIYNKSGRDIYIYQDGSSNGTRINVNSSAKVNCASNYTYKYDANAGGKGSVCYSANSRCGSSITVN